MWVKRVKKKGIEIQGVKPPTPTWAIDALISDEEWTEKGKRSKNETRSRPPAQLPWNIWLSPIMSRVHKVSVFFYHPQPCGLGWVK